MGRDEHWAGDVCKEAVLLTSGDNTAVPASRTARLSRIRALIRSEQISSQAELARRLAGEGIVVSQGTLSRDLKDAGAVRGRDHLGNFQYSIPEGEHPSDVTTGLPAWNHLAKICHTLCTEVSCNDGAVVVKTPPGAAQYLGSAIDTSGSSAILGTVAGDDTVLILCKSGAWGPDLARAFRQMAETGLPAEGLLAAEPDSSRWGTSTAS
ncbi:arginine repressor [Cutibacterium avidum]|mgnify:FL=1|nr:arginine repressor [Cutibacterium avidum]KXA67163.1 arginine repressor protein [Cutibacterium avidum]MCO6632437.1 arginine repressor [Cutibacterium avidum]MCO6660839.1 arginine repressor [Cutibacterium avidum]MCO6665413.1 arginine repressor [Cutibacterium avidum]MCO6672179.1 arginine repressor [Cutibacterium avidum]